ncbi:MAG: ATP-binding cassette subfamily F protein uup [Sphingobacteriales bacterium]|jgi:ATP-binding cassette subfamily F protein uup
MNYLSVENLAKSYGERVLFENLSFGIDQGQKIAFVAKNGTGKSTLLKIIAGKETQDSGNVIFNKGLVVGYLEQNPEPTPGNTILEEVFEADTPELKVIKELKIHTDSGDSDKVSKVLEEMDRLNAWDFESKVEQVLSTLQINDLSQNASTLSGGQKKRVALAKIILRNPDLIILDEPTNHLDTEMIEWLEEFLGNAKVTLLMITHDRYFLDRVCNEILELDQGALFAYKGNYEYFLEKKHLRHATADAEVDKAQNLLSKELEWMRRQPKARTTKSKARIDSFYDLEESAQGRKKDDSVELEINMSRLGNKILELHNVSKSYGDKEIIKDFKYIFKRKERVGIVGPNGTGKTTLISLFTGHLMPDKGKTILGETVVFGHYHQEGMKFKEEMRVIDVVKEIAEFIPLTKGRTLTASQLLERFLFTPHAHYTPVSKLSGGERRRLYLLTILMKNPNFLILDEPTNDLDILTLTVLEDFLKDFPGCLVIVSHDRFFLDKLVDHLFILRGNGEVKDFNGTYSDYRHWVKEQDSIAMDEKKNASKPAPVVKAAAPVKPKAAKLTFAEKIEKEKLEKEIEKLEAEKEKLEAEMNSSAVTPERVAYLSQEYGKASAGLDEAEMRWLELEEKGAN